MQVATVDPRDERAFGRWFAVMNTSRWGVWPDVSVSPDLRQEQETALEMARPGAARIGHLLLLERDGVPVGAARIALPVRDNTATAELELHVSSGARRQGVGSALLIEVDRFTAGRTQLFTEVYEPDGHTFSAAPGRAFALRRGFRQGLVEIRSSLALPLDSSRMASLGRTSAASAGSYSVRLWQDWVPEELLEERAALERNMSRDVPWGDIAHEEEDYDGARIREEERLVHAQGRSYLGAAALDEAGSMVAFTDLGLSRDHPGSATQWGTFVLTAHRGNRLGIALKLALVQELQRRSPATERITTWNAETNTAMIDVNEAIGFRRDGQRSAWTRERQP